MIIDLFHNKIVKDNMSDAFKERVYAELLPLLTDRYGTLLRGVQMYEDYLDLGFMLDGEFYYPLTLVFDDGARREWIKWNAVGKRRFADGVPFAFIGDGEIGFSIVEKAPEGFEERLEGRAMYFEGGAAALKIDAPVSNKTLLVGKYSQTFIDEMARQLTSEIENAFSVEGLSESGVELLFVFAPGTYMEHRQGNVTYRRLLISARACGARDLWIKWTRLDGGAPYTVTDNVSADTVKFELGEDVSQKIREKEYRFLVSTSSEKYQAAMGRRNITEWRDMIKRVIKRGELKKLDVVKEDPERMGELANKLQEVLPGYSAPVRTTATPDNSDINALLRSVIGGSSESAPEEAAEAPVTEPTEVDLPWETESETAFAPDTAVAEPAAEAEEAEEAEAPATVREETGESPAAEAESASARDIEAELRRKIEAEIRAELEKEAQRRSAEEAEELRRAHERLKAEKEELESRAREAEEKLRKEAEAIAENERLRAELDSLQRAEAREKERMAEAARLAIDEQRRIEAERAIEDAKAVREAERKREEERLLAEKKAEEERIAEEERRRAEAAALAEAERKKEEAAKKEAEAAAQREAERKKAEAAAAEAAKPAYTYVSKNVRLLFKHPVDQNITKRIHEIILSAIKYFHKEHVYMKVKPSIPDPTTVNLHFVKFPEEEHDFLVDIIKVLGKSEIGITKAFLE